MTQELLRCIVELCEQMVCSGAEVYRVEDSMERMCTAYGAVRVDAYVTTSNIVVTCEMADGREFTHTRRIRSSSVNIEKLHALNSLARQVTRETPTAADFREGLERAEHVRTYSFWQQIFFYALIAGAFTVFFGSRSIRETAASFVIGGIVGALVLMAEKYSVNKMMIRFFGSVVFSTLAFVCLHVGFVRDVDNIIIGNIMSLIPGVGFTNALRDLFAGDTMTGILRAIEAILLASCMVLGYIAVAYIYGGVAG